MIEVNTDIPLPPAKVWQYLTLTDHIEKWWGSEVMLERRKGGKFSEPWVDPEGKPRHTSGMVTALEDDTRLQLNWQDDGWQKPTRVEFLLTKAPNGGTVLTVHHSGWDVLDDGPRKKIFDQYLAGWRELMNKFRLYCLQEG